MKFHKGIAKEDPAVYDQFYSTHGGTSSSSFLTRVYSGAWSRDSTATKRNVHFSQSSIKIKPSSAKTVTSQKNISRGLTPTQVIKLFEEGDSKNRMNFLQMENILDDELSQFEQQAPLKEAR